MSAPHGIRSRLAIVLAALLVAAAAPQAATASHGGLDQSGGVVSYNLSSKVLRFTGNPGVKNYLEVAQNDEGDLGSQYDFCIMCNDYELEPGRSGPSSEDDHVWFLSKFHAPGHPGHGIIGIKPSARAIGCDFIDWDPNIGPFPHDADWVECPHKHVKSITIDVDDGDDSRHGDQVYAAFWKRPLTIRTGRGNDAVVGGFNSDTIDVGLGDDKAWGDPVAVDDNGDQVTPPSSLPFSARGGRNGDDTILGRLGHDFLVGAQGEDRISGDAGVDTLYGLEGNDTLRGQNGGDVIFGGRDNDQIAGGNGNDAAMWGQDGDDVINASFGNDANIRGDAGFDWVSYFGTNRPVRAALRAGEGNGAYDPRARPQNQQRENDVFGDEIENLQGGSRSDLLTGNDGINVLRGHDGNDTLHGLGQHDELRGQRGHDVLNGGDRNDELYGSSGNDTLDGQLGPDDMVGGSGSDTVRYAGRLDSIEVFLALKGTGQGGEEDGTDTNVPGRTGDRILTIENIIGGLNADTLLGDNAANKITGEAGADNLEGNGGQDTIIANDKYNDQIDCGSSLDFAAIDPPPLDQSRKRCEVVQPVD